jgi:hypothetical protein
MVTRRQDFFVQLRMAGLDQDSSVGKTGNNSSFHLLFSIFYFLFTLSIMGITCLRFTFFFCTGGSSTGTRLWSPRCGHDDSGVEHLDSAPCTTDHSSMFAARNNVCQTSMTARRPRRLEIERIGGGVVTLTAGHKFISDHRLPWHGSRSCCWLPQQLRIASIRPLQLSQYTADQTTPKFLFSTHWNFPSCVLSSCSSTNWVC